MVKKCKNTECNKEIEGHYNRKYCNDKCYNRGRYLLNIEIAKERQRAYYKKNSSSELAKRKVFYRDNEKRIKTERRDRRLNNVVVLRASEKKRYEDVRYYQYITKTYGISKERLLEMRDEQNDCCAICGESQDNLTRRLSVDHCHKTNKVRGLLCDKCNRGIGGMEDNVEILASSISYLQQPTLKFSKKEKKYHWRSKEYQKDTRMKRKYGIALSNYEDLTVEQNNCCSICGKKSKLHIDHNHDTGAVRGLLCFQCNSALGSFNDNIEILASAISFLGQKY